MFTFNYEVTSDEFLAMHLSLEGILGKSAIGPTTTIQRNRMQTNGLLRDDKRRVQVVVAWLWKFETNHQRTLRNSQCSTPLG